VALALNNSEVDKTMIRNRRRHKLWKAICSWRKELYILKMLKTWE